MNTNEAMEFLRNHQPLPPTRGIDESLLKWFDEVREFFAEHPDPRSVPLLLNAFGEGDGHGIYQMVEKTILCHPENIVVPALLNGLRSHVRSVRVWNAEIAANYSRPEFVVPLSEMLLQGSFDERMAAVIALEAIGNSEAMKALEGALTIDIEKEVKSAIREVLRS